MNDADLNVWHNFKSILLLTDVVVQYLNGELLLECVILNC